MILIKENFNKKNLFFSLLSVGIFSIIYGITFRSLANKIPDITLFIWIIGFSLLTGMGIIVLFPVYEKPKKKKKKNDIFKRTIMSKRK